MNTCVETSSSESEVQFAVNPADGVRVAFTVEGHGTPLLMVHGSLHTREMWRKLHYTPALSKHHQLILIDVRGHGHSGKPHWDSDYQMEAIVGDLCAVLDKLGVESTHYLGYSLGGRVGYALATRFPERLRSLAVGGGTHRTLYGWFERQIYPGFIRRLEEGGIDGFIKAWGEHRGREVSPKAQAELRQNDAKALAAYFRQASREPGIDEDVLAAMHIPTLLFAGTKDVDRFADSLLAQYMLPKSKFVPLHGVDHARTMANVELMVRHLVPFFAHHDRADSSEDMFEQLAS